MKTLARITTMAFAAVMLLFISNAAALAANEQGKTAEQLYQTIEESLIEARDSMTRTGSGKAPGGIIVGTPMNPYPTKDGIYDDKFAIIMTTRERPLMEDFREKLSLSTGIPESQIGFLFMDVDNPIWHEPLQIKVSLEDMFVMNPVDFISVLRDNPEAFLEAGHTPEEIAAAVENIKDELAERGIAVTVNETITVEEIGDIHNKTVSKDTPPIQQLNSVSLRMGDAIAVHMVPYQTYEVYTVGPPANTSNGNRFFTATHGRWPVGASVYQVDLKAWRVGQQIGSITRTTFNTRTATDFTEVTLINSNRIQQPFVTPAGWPLTNFSGFAVDGALATSFGPISNRAFSGPIMDFSSMPGAFVIDGFDFANMNVANFGNFHMIGGDSGAGLFDRGTSLGVHNFAVAMFDWQGNFAGYFHTFTKPQRYN